MARSPSYSETVLADRPVGYWRCDDAATLTDSSGNGLDGSTTSVTAAPGLLAGDPDGALSFDGAASVCSVPDDPALDFTAAITLEAWITPAVLDGTRTIVSKGDSQYELAIRLAHDSREPTLIFRSVITDYVWGFGPTLAVGATYHVVFALDRALNVFGCVNGVVYPLSQTGVAPPPLATSTDPLLLGSKKGGGSWFDGVIDEVAVYDYGFSEEQALTHWIAGATAEPGGAETVVEVAFNSAAAGDYRTLVLADGAIAYFRCGDPAGSLVLADASQVNVGGSVMGAATISGSVTFGEPGGLLGDTDTSALFDGSTGYASLFSSSMDGVISGGWTVEAWVYPTVARSDLCAILTTEFPGSGAIPFMLGYGNPSRLANGSIDVDSVPVAGFFGAGDRWYSVGDSVALSLDEWTYLAATWDGTTLTLYRDGVQVAAQTPGVATSPGSGTLLVGRRWDTNGTTPYFPGRIDEAAVYPSALDARTVASHYAARVIGRPLVWTDVSDRVLSYQAAAGRQHELDRYEAATATIVLDNSDRRFEPGYQGRLANYNLNPSCETSVTGWTGRGVLAQAADAPPGSTGTKCGQATYTTTAANDSIWLGFAGPGPGDYLPVAPGDEVYVSGQAKWASGPLIDDMWIVCRWQDAAGNEISDTQLHAGTGRILNPTLDVWYPVYGTAVAPAGAAKAIVFCYASTGSVLGEHVFRVDELEICPASVVPDTSSLFYADGDQDGCRWAGTPHASQSYRGGPYYPNVLPYKQIRVSERKDGASFPVFAGWIERWPEAWSGPTLAKTTIDATDGFDLLAAATLDTSTVDYLASSTAYAFRNLLAYAARWDQDTYPILTGNPEDAVTISPPVDGQIAILDLARNLETTENGELYLDRRGRPVFRLAGCRTGTPSLCTFGDSDGETRYTDMQPSLDRDRIVNDVQVTRQGGSLQEAIDSDSIIAYAARSLSLSTYHATDADALALAKAIVAAEAQPELRFEQVTFTVAADGSDNRTLVQLLTRRIGDRITVIRRPDPDDPSQPISQECLISHIQTSRQPDQIQAVWQLVPAP